MSALHLIVALLFVGTSALFVPASSPIIYHSKWNWYVNASTKSIEAANPGPFIRFTVQHTSQIVLVLDKPQREDYFANVAWSIDNGKWANYGLGTQTRVTLASGLKTDQLHTVYLYIKNSNGWIDRWIGPSTNVRIMGIEVDDSATVALPADLSKKTMLVYWDSIGAGANTVKLDHTGFDIQTDDTLPTFGFTVAEALGVELSLMAWGGQGLSVGAAGNVPPLWSAEGTSNTSSWNWYNSRQPRLFHECPDIIFNGHGTNDGLSQQPASKVKPRVIGWLKSVRQVCPKATVLQVIPFGRFVEEAVTQAFSEYQSLAKDRKSHLIALGPRAAMGLDRIVVNGTFCSGDGIHPWGWRSSQLGAMLAAAVLPFV